MMYVGRNRIHYSEIDSTNEELKRLFKEEELDNGTLLTADYQTGGKGQMGAGWKSSKGKNFLGTFFLNSNPVLEEVFVLNMIMSLAVKETVSEFVNGKVEIKWPNDIVVEGKKIAGILIENKLQKSVLAGVFLGLGLNVNQKVFPDLNRKATSLSKEVGAEIDLESVITRLSFNLQQFYSLYEAKGYATINFLYHQDLYLKGEEYVYKVGKDTRFFTLQSVNKQGDLQLFNQFGKIEEFGLKEIEFQV